MFFTVSFAGSCVTLFAIPRGALHCCLSQTTLFWCPLLSPRLLPPTESKKKITEKPRCLRGPVIGVWGVDFHFTFHCTLFWSSKAFAVQFFALQSALLGDFKTKRVAHSLSWKVSRVRKGTEDTTGRGKASWWAWIASLIWFGFILACGLGNVLTGYSNARIR